MARTRKSGRNRTPRSMLRISFDPTQPNAADLAKAWDDEKTRTIRNMIPPDSGKIALAHVFAFSLADRQVPIKNLEMECHSCNLLLTEHKQETRFGLILPPGRLSCSMSA